MTVKEVVLTAATEVGCREEVEAYYLGTSSTGERKAKLLLACFNLVESGLALDYLPLYATATLNSGTGKVRYDDFSHDVVRITEVTDLKGNALDFTLYSDHLETQAGGIKITYTYTPQKKTIDEDSDFYLYVSPQLLSYGVAAEYCLALGLFEEAAIWDRKYKDSLEMMYHSKPGRKITSRRWI